MEDNAKTLITVAGDYVQSKHVDYEIGKVETGGIGIQIINGQPQESKPAPQRKTRTTKQGTKYTQATFIYRHIKEHKNRITFLFQALLKAQWIDNKTKSDDFYDVFSGKVSNAHIKWIAPQAYLYYLIRQIVQKELVILPEKTTIWQITENHFVDANSRPFHDFNKQKTPGKFKNVIERLADILDPSIKDED